jgi:hypothetical protein
LKSKNIKAWKEIIKFFSVWKSFGLTNFQCFLMVFINSFSFLKCWKFVVLNVMGFEMINFLRSDGDAWSFFWSFATLLLCYFVTLLLCYFVTLLLCYFVTVLTQNFHHKKSTKK